HVLAQWESALAQQQSFVTECRLQRHDNSVLWILGQAEPLRNRHGKVTGYLGTITDISQRKEAEESLQESVRLASLLGAVGVTATRESHLQTILQRCAELLVEQLRAAFARIWTLNEATQTLELQASAGIYTHLNGPHSRIAVGQWKIGR